MSEVVRPSDPDWNAWATFSSHVTEALAELPTRPLFSRRRAVAGVLWRMGYRPTEAQICELIERQHTPTTNPQQPRLRERQETSDV